MAYKRKRSYGGSRRRVKRRMPMRTTRVPRAVRTSNLVSIKRSYKVADYQINYASGFVATPFYFTLNTLPNYTEFTNLFEVYRINAIKLTFLPIATGNDLPSITGNTATGAVWALTPRVYYTIDKDGNPPSTENGFLERSNMKIVRRPFSGWQIYIRNPCVQSAVANSVTLVGGSPKSRQWIDCDNYGVAHWGCAVGGQIPSGSTTSAMTWQVIATYYMQFKGAV